MAQYRVVYADVVDVATHLVLFEGFTLDWGPGSDTKGN